MQREHQRGGGCYWGRRCVAMRTEPRGRQAAAKAVDQTRVGRVDGDVGEVKPRAAQPGNPAEQIRQFQNRANSAVRQPPRERMDGRSVDNHQVIVELKGPSERIDVSGGNRRRQKQEDEPLASHRSTFQTSAEWS